MRHPYKLSSLPDLPVAVGLGDFHTPKSGPVVPAIVAVVAAVPEFPIIVIAIVA